jgi:hypothetical protein
MTMNTTKAALILLIAGAWTASCGGGAAVPTTPVSPPASASPPAAADPTPAPPPSTTLAAEPAPQPTPELCPAITKVTSRLYKLYDPLGNLVDKPMPGGKAIIDATPRFDGQVCNVEHDNCGGRDCEDPRGADWKLVEGKSKTKVNGYQFLIGPLVDGVHTWRVCPLPDAKDGQDDRVPIGDDPCTEGTFIVG